MSMEFFNSIDWDHMGPRTPIPRPASSPSAISTKTSSSTSTVTPHNYLRNLPRPSSAEAEMDRRNHHLPTGRGGYPPASSAVPPYLAPGAQQSSSTGSTDSIMTQVPLPYYMAGEPHAQGSGFFVTPEIQSQGTFEPFNGGAPGGRSNSTSLNPNSAPYVPPGSAYPQYNQYEGAFGHQLPPGTSMMNMAGPEQDYYGQQAYGPADMGGLIRSPQLAPAPPFHHQYPIGFFGPYPGGQGMNDYQQQGYGMAQPVPPPVHYQQSVHSPTSSFASGSTQGWNNHGYIAPHAQVVAGQMLMQYGQPHLAPGMHGQAWAPQYGAQFAGPPGQHPYVLPANINRGKTVVKCYPRGGDQNNNRASNNNGGGGLKMNKLKHGQNKHGGPVLPPPPKMKDLNSLRSKTSQASSSMEYRGQPGNHLVSQTASQASSSKGYHSQPGNELVSQTASQTTSEDETKSYSSMGSPTPGPKVRKEIEFASESRAANTPSLRSRRGQSIRQSFTDPARKTTTDWVNTLQGPPPKMMNLLNDAISGHEVSRLGSINESDPFVGNTPASATRSNPPLLNNPFGPHQLTIANKNAYQQGVSVELLRLTNNCTSRPTADVAVDSIPFVEYCRLNRTYNHGVIKLKNIPYTVNRPEVLAFLGRNARIISEQDFEPVHIVMERVTSKTLDCYVEFADLNEAVAAVNRYENNRMTGRNGRLGQRHVDMELSSQDALMKDLFPKAKNVNWRDGKPTIIPTNPHDKYNSGFQGFISKEELVMLVKHVETPQRSPFSKECPQRPYECLISTLFKYPWYMVDYITIEDRDLLYDATSKLLDLLRDRLKSTPEQDINLSPMLYKRVWRAAIKCQGFTPTMKDNIAFKHELPSDLMQEMGVPLFAADWHYLWTIGPKPGAPHDIILWYAAVMREYLDSKKEQVPLADKAAKGEKLERAKLFGDLEKYFGHPVDRKVFGALTLAQVAANEWSGIETVLRLALAPAIEAPASA